MSDQDQVIEEVDEEIERSDEELQPPGFQCAADFVDAEIDLLDDGSISDLSVEALVTLTVLRIVDNPDELRVNITRASRMTVIELDVHEDDLGKVIGKYGHTIDAIRSIARSAAGESPIEYDIVPLEKGKPPARNRRRRGNHNNWRRYRGADRRRHYNR